MLSKDKSCLIDDCLDDLIGKIMENEILHWMSTCMPNQWQHLADAFGSMASKANVKGWMPKPPMAILCRQVD